MPNDASVVLHRKSGFTPVSQIHPAELSQMRDFIDRVLEQGQASTIKLTCRTKVGTFLEYAVKKGSVHQLAVDAASFANC